MISFSRCLALLAMLSGSALGPSLAASLAASSISESIGASIGSASASIKRSSDSSSKTTPVAAGEYAVVEVVAITDIPGMLRVTLRALTTTDAEMAADPHREFYLILPQAAFEQGHLARGSTVTVRRHNYGLEFLAAGSRQAFFLVVDDEVLRELQTLPVVL